MSTPIVGREREIEILEEIYQSSDPHFLAVYGRRRIGKTFLISEFFKPKGLYFEITGIKGRSLKGQLFEFTREFSLKFNEGNPITPPKTWGEALKSLQQAIIRIPIILPLLKTN
ncbi:MAG: hypothetical protein NTX49_04000 [Chlamydiae bacterium]|nr:hypothetical protein [Chlamydiota bacterium]